MKLSTKNEVKMKPSSYKQKQRACHQQAFTEGNSKGRISGQKKVIASGRNRNHLNSTYVSKYK